MVTSLYPQCNTVLTAVIVAHSTLDERLPSGRIQAQTFARAPSPALIEFGDVRYLARSGRH